MSSFWCSQNRNLLENCVLLASKIHEIRQIIESDIFCKESFYTVPLHVNQWTAFKPIVEINSTAHAFLHLQLAGIAYTTSTSYCWATMVGDRIYEAILIFELHLPPFLIL